MKITILTLGCKVNQAESAFIEGNFMDLGCSIVQLSDHPDYCIINTCSVTAKSDYQSRQLIRRAVRAGAKVIVTGCYSQLRAEEIKTIEGVIDIVQNRDKLQIINILSDKPKSTYLPYDRQVATMCKDTGWMQLCVLLLYSSKGEREITEPGGY